MHKKYARNFFCEKLGAKFPATIRGYSMVKFARLDDPFSEFFLTGPSLQQKDKKMRKRKGEKTKQKA